jgi:hypothetical protein
MLDTDERRIFGRSRDTVAMLDRVLADLKGEQASVAASVPRPTRSPNQPSEDRQNDILAALKHAGTPLTRPELVSAMRMRTEGKLGHQLAWMVENHVLINVPSRGYWPADEPVPE